MLLKKNKVELIYFFILICILIPQFVIANSEISVEINDEIYENFEEESVLKREAMQELGTDTDKSNANLKLMRVDYEGLTPSFENNVYEYYLTVPSNINNLEVVANSENPNANIEIKGNKDLKEGLNIVEIDVISEDKSNIEKYKIEVTKITDLQLANTNLETLAIENTLLNPVFDNNIVHYTAKVSHLVKDLRTLIIPENEKATVKVEGVNNLKVGKNPILITVVAPNGYTKKEIIIDVYKGAVPVQLQEEKNVEDQEEKIKEEYKVKKTFNSNEEEFQIEKLDDIQESLEIGNSSNEFFISVLKLIILISILVLIIYSKKRKNNKK